MADQKVDEPRVNVPVNNQTDTDTGFDVPKDDPRHTENRGGLENIIESPPAAQPDVGGNTGTGGAGPANLGTTGADLSNTDPEHDLGASGTGVVNSGQTDMSTIGKGDPDAGPVGAGPVEGSRSGATAPKVEMTDVGLVDVNLADMTPPGEGDEDASVASDK